MVNRTIINLLKYKYLHQMHHNQHNQLLYQYNWVLNHFNHNSLQYQCIHYLHNLIVVHNQMLLLLKNQFKKGNHLHNYWKIKKKGIQIFNNLNHSIIKNVYLFNHHLSHLWKYNKNNYNHYSNMEIIHHKHPLLNQQHHLYHQRHCN